MAAVAIAQDHEAAPGIGQQDDAPSSTNDATRNEGGFIVLRGKPVHFRRGLPVLDEAALKYSAQYTRECVFGPFILHGIGLAQAYAVHQAGDTALYDAQIALLRSVNAGWMFICVVVFGLLTIVLNCFPMHYKHKVVHSADDRAALRVKFLSNLSGPNQQIYKQLSSQPNGKPTAEEAARGYIVIENEGAIGAFNRANRSMHNFVENNVASGARILCCAFVYPFPTFVTTCFYFVGRVMHQVGYSGAVGFNSTVRLVGFALFTELLGEVPQLGMCLYGGIMALRG